MQFFMKILLCGIIITMCYRSACGNKIPFDTIVVFSDSDSDTGNVYSLTGGRIPAPPYYQGRYSDGPVWLDQLGVSNVMNYAHGGASTDNTFSPGLTSGSEPVPGAKQQVEMYLHRTDLSRVDFDRTVYVIWIGAADFGNNMTIDPAAVANSFANSIHALLRVRAKHIVAASLSPLQAYPFSIRLGVDEFLTQATNQFNSHLRTIVNNLQNSNPTVSLRIFDLHGIILKVVANQSVLKFENTVGQCWNRTEDNNVIMCSNPSGYVFIDSVHFTTRVHGLLADNMRRFLSSSTSSIHSFTWVSSLFTFLFLLDFLF